MSVTSCYGAPQRGSTPYWGLFERFCERFARRSRSYGRHELVQSVPGGQTGLLQEPLSRLPLIDLGCGTNWVPSRGGEGWGRAVASSDTDAPSGGSRPLHPQSLRPLGPGAAALNMDRSFNQWFDPGPLRVSLAAGVLMALIEDALSHSAFCRRSISNRAQSGGSRPLHPFAQAAGPWRCRLHYESCLCR